MLSSVSPSWTTWTIGVGVMVGVVVATGGRSGAVAVRRSAGVGTGGVDVLTSGVTMVGCGVITWPQAVNTISVAARKAPRTVFFTCRTPTQRLYQMHVETGRKYQNARKNREKISTCT
jgi:hypothetical protein